MHRFFFFLALCLAIPAYSQTVTGTIQSGGLTREYRLFIPSAYNGTTAVPLVLNLHGYGSNNFEQDLYANFWSLADTANFIIALPNGTLDPIGSRYWNAFDVGGVDDVAFIDNLIDTLSALYNIDPQRIYSTGFSNGGFMSYKLACALSNRIAAIAPVSGTSTQELMNMCDPGRPLPVFHIHGDADPVVPYNGGSAGPFSNLLGAEALTNIWVEKNNCNATPTITPIPNVVVNDGCTAERLVYANGDLGSSVELIRIDNGGHTWPGAIINLSSTCMDFSASREIWLFFRRYTLGQFTDAPEPASAGGWRLNPNPVSDNFALMAAGGDYPVRLRVFNAAGNLVLDLRQTDGTISSASWASGLYVLVAEGSDGTRQIFRLIKQ